MKLLRKKLAFIGIAIAIGTVALGGAGGAAATPLDPFLGTWWAIDPSDSSLEQVTFGADGSLFFRDDYATSCGGVVAVLNDAGTVSGNTWTGSGRAILRCPAIGQTRGPIFFQFTLNADGTLSGVGPEVWTRVRPVSTEAATSPNASVTGAGWRGNVGNPTTPITHFVVSAHNGPQGAAGTYISMNANNPLLNFTGDVTCLYVVGDQAIVGGVVTSGGEPGQIGTGFAVGFLDNAGPTPDTVAFDDLELATPVDCAAETFLFTLTMFPVLNGNIEIGDAR